MESSPTVQRKAGTVTEEAPSTRGSIFSTSPTVIPQLYIVQRVWTFDIIFVWVGKRNQIEKQCMQFMDPVHSRNSSGMKLNN